MIDRLYEAFPNPFGEQTTISFSLAVPGRVDVDVYDVLGRRVAVLIDGTLPSGRHSVVWNGTSGETGRLAPGAYFIRLRTGSVSATRSVVLTR